MRVSAFSEIEADSLARVREKARLWNLFAQTPPPVGYDPIAFWPGGREDPRFGVLRLIPWRIEVTSLADLMKGGGKIWQRE